MKIVKFIATFVIIITLFIVTGILPANAENFPVPAGTLPKIAPSLPEPPEGFSPLSATSEQLKYYGFPERPNDKASLDIWLDIMSHAAHYVKPVQIPTTAVHGQMGTNESMNWAGHVLVNTNNVQNGYAPHYYSASGVWTQPSYPTGNGRPAYWVGMGGVTTSYLVQAGTDANATAINPILPRNCWWVENAPWGAIFQTTPVINSGNSLYVSVTYNGGSTSTGFLMNYTTSTYTSVQFYTHVYDGSSAEYVYEAVGVPTIPYASFSTVSFTYCYLFWNNDGGTSGQGYFTNYNWTKYNMDYNGVRKATTSNASNGAFTITSY